MSGRAETRAAQAIAAAVREGRDELDLQGLGLKELPELPRDLDHLRSLRLSGNRLQDLPPHLWRLTQLERLDLGSNRLRGLDPGIGRLARLESLDISENRVTTLPSELASCTRLAHLDLFHNLLTALPPAVLALPALTSLDVARNRLEELPEFSGRLTGLKALDLSGNRLAALPLSIGTLASVQTLNLSGNQLTSIAEIVPLTALEELFVDDNALRQLPAGLASLPRLRVLSLKGNPLADAPEWLEGLKAPNSSLPEARTLGERVTGGYEPGSQYFDAPLRIFEFSLSLADGAAVTQSLDLYFKQFAGTPVSLVLPGGESVDLGRLGRKGALQFAAGHAATSSPLADRVSGGAPEPGSPSNSAAVLTFQPTSDAADVRSACEFAERTINRVPGVGLGPALNREQATREDRGEPPPELRDRDAGRSGALPTTGEDIEGLVTRVVAEHPADAGQTRSAAAGAEPVDAAVFCPARVARPGAFLVQVFLYPPGAEATVEARAQTADGTAVQRGTHSLPMDLPHGARVDLHLEAPGLVVAEPDAMVVWRGRPTAAQFEVSVPADAPGPDAILRIRFAIEGVPAGTLRFKVALADAAAEPEPPSLQPAHGVKYSQAFVSYSSQDRAEVLRRVQAFKIAGIKVFQDILDLEPGDRWARELYREIDRCDVFLLFWSHAAAKSEWVAKEIEYALARKAGDDDGLPHIQPVPIEGPPIVPPPANLRNLHFNDALLAQIQAAQKPPADGRPPGGAQG